MWKPLAPKRLKIVPAAVVAVVVAILVNEFGRPLFEALGARIGPAVDDHGGIGGSGCAYGQPRATRSSRSACPAGLLSAGAGVEGGVHVRADRQRRNAAVRRRGGQQHTGPRTNFDRELMGAGRRNSICGLLGALRMTGVIVRSRRDLEAGREDAAVR